MSENNKCINNVPQAIKPIIEDGRPLNLCRRGFNFNLNNNINTNLPFVRAYSSFPVDNGQRVTINSYQILQDGGLGNSLIGNSFIAPSQGLYNFCYNVYFQLPDPGHTLENEIVTFSVDGEREFRIFTNNSDTFYGSYHNVPPDSYVSSRTAFRFPIEEGVTGFALEDPLSSSPTFLLFPGDAVSALVYQNNSSYIGGTGSSEPTEGTQQQVFVELMITRISSENVMELPPGNRGPIGAPQNN